MELLLYLNIILRGVTIKGKSLFISLLLIAVVMLSVSATFAASDDAAVGDGITNDEDVLAIEDEGSIAVKDDAIVKADSSNEVYGNSSDIVTKDTFKNYFDSEGFLYDNVTSDELIFEGDFSGVIDTIFVNKSVKFTGNDATFNGTSFVILSSNVVIDGFTLISNNTDVYGIRIDEGISDVVISNNYIDFTAKDDSDAFAIWSLAVNNLKIINNTIAFVGNTVGERVNNAIYIQGSAELDEYDEVQTTLATNIVIDNNNFKIQIPSVPVHYDSYIGHPVSEGIVFEICENVTFTNNDVNVRYNNVSGSYDTIYAVSVKSPQVVDPVYGMPMGAAMSKNIEIADNSVLCFGHQYIYGIYMAAEGFDIHDNGMNIVSDDYYANAIDIEGPSSDGFVSNNVIFVSSNGAAYGIYSAQVMGAVEDMVYFNNTVSGYSYAVCAMELMEKNPEVKNNTIFLGGNYTYGIVASIGDIANIHDNAMGVIGSNEGNTSTGDPILPLNTIGISLKGTADVYQNTIASTGIGINALDCDVDFYYNNIAVAAQGNVDNYAVYVTDAKYVTIGLNNVTFVGKSDGKTKTNAVYIKNAAAGSIFENNFNITIPSAPVDWQEIPKGSGNWVGLAVSEGIVLDDCNNVEFNQNDVTLNYSESIGMFGTIYVLDLKGDKITVSENFIQATGGEYIYGLLIAGDDFEVINNTISIKSDVYYANGIDIEGDSYNGVVSYNNIGVQSEGLVYGIYSAMYGNVSDITYSNNNILASGYVACAMELMENNPSVFENIIYMQGNYTYGIVASIKDKGEFIKNEIVAESTNIGNASSGDPILPLTSMAISTKGDADIFQNIIHSHAIGVSCIEGEVNIFANEIDVEAVGDVDNYAIVVNDIPDLSIFENNVTFVGTTDGIAITNAVYLGNVSSSRIKSNNFDIIIPSAPVDWKEIPEGSGNWVQSALTEGIVIKGDKDIIIADNNITLNYSDSIGMYGTIYVLDVDADGVTIKENNIEATGDEYIYGIQMSGKDFQIIDNEIAIISDLYANGIDIEGPANGLVESNVVEVKANTSAYAIYSGMNGQNVTTQYINNSIEGTGYNVFGFSLGDIETDVIENYVFLVGNYSTGIAYRGELITVSDNNLIIYSSEVGDEEIWEDFGVEAVGIKVIMGSADIEGNTIATLGKGVSLTGDLLTVALINNTFAVMGNDDKDAYAIYAKDVKSQMGLFIEDNSITYKGTTAGTGINNAVYLNNVTISPILDGNIFNLELVSSYVPWKEIPDGSGNWVSFPVSEGIVIKNSPGAILSHNEINVNYTDVVGMYDTIYVVDINSDDVQVFNNEINATGNSYIYGIIISGDNFKIYENDIETASNYYANGIDVEGPATGEIEDNGIMAKATVSAYPIYSGMNGQNTSVEYIDNDIIGEAYFVIGMSLGDVESEVIGNDIIATGNYTIGIGYRGSKLIVDNNLVISNASNVGDEDIWDAFGTETEGIKIVKGDSIITFNNVETTAFYAVNALNTNASVHDNYLVGKKFIGDESVDNAINSEVYNNTPTSANKTATIVTITEVNGFGDVTGFVTDINGTPIAKDIVKFVTDDETGYAKTDENGMFVVYDVVNEVDIIFEGDSFFLASNATITLTDVAPARTETTVEITTPVGYKVGDDVNVTIYVTGAIGPITVIVDGAVDEALLNENGTAVYTIENITQGHHSIVAIFEGDETHEASFDATTIDVNVVATDFANVTVSGDLNITATLVDAMGEVIANATITYTVGNITNTTTTDANGLFSIQAVNDETVTIDYAGEYPFLPTTLTLTFKDIASAPVEARFDIPGGQMTIYGYAVDTKADEKGIAFATTLLDSEGKPIAGVPIKFALNDKVYNRTTNEYGSFDPYNLNMQKAQKYTLAFYFAEDGNYTSAFASVCADLAKKPITIKASAKSYKASAKTKSYTVTLTTIVGSSADGKVHLSPKKVTLLVNGKTYNGKTDAKGKVTFKLTNLSKKGVYTAKISYAGDNTYESATKSVKITIK